MIHIKLVPLEGINIDTIGVVRLSEPRAEVEARLGKPDMGPNENQYYYASYECRIDFDGLGRVAFIEFIYGPFPERTQLSIHGIDPFALEANDLIQLLTEHNGPLIDASEADYSYVFVTSSVGVWRDATPRAIEEMIATSRAAGEYEANQAWLTEELEKSRHFWTIGIGVRNYYA